MPKDMKDRPKVDIVRKVERLKMEPPKTPKIKDPLSVQGKPRR